MRLIALPLPHPRSVLAAGFMVLVTSLPAAIPAGEICAAYRLRWQVELAFKRLKSLLHIDRLWGNRNAIGAVNALSRDHPPV
jgi:IS4 transposase